MLLVGLIILIIVLSSGGSTPPVPPPPDIEEYDNIKTIVPFTIVP